MKIAAGKGIACFVPALRRGAPEEFAGGIGIIRPPFDVACRVRESVNGRCSDDSRTLSGQQTIRTFRHCVETLPRTHGEKTRRLEGGSGIGVFKSGGAGDVRRVSEAVMGQGKTAAGKLRGRREFTGMNGSAGPGENHFVPELQIFQCHIPACDARPADKRAFPAAPCADRHIVDGNVETRISSFFQKNRHSRLDFGRHSDPHR